MNKSHQRHIQQTGDLNARNTIQMLAELNSIVEEMHYNSA